MMRPAGKILLLVVVAVGSCGGCRDSYGLGARCRGRRSAHYSGGDTDKLRGRHRKPAASRGPLRYLTCRL